MKVIIDGRLLLPQMTGIGRYLMGLTSGLSQLTGDHKYELWLQKNLPNFHPVWELENKNLSLKQIEIDHMELCGHWKVPNQLRTANYDLFHYPHFDLPLFVPGKVVTTIHDLKYLAHPDFFPRFGAMKRMVMWVMMLFAVHRADFVMTVSKHTKHDITRYLKVNPEKVFIVPEGVDGRFYGSQENSGVISVLRKYQAKQPFFLHVGEMRPHKNIERAIEAFGILLKNQNIKHQFVISGKTYADYDGPRKTVRRLGLDRFVRFTYISDADLPLMYQAADGCVLLSLYEGFGLPVLEAMASGTPVIASNTSSIPEIVGDAGILVDPLSVDEAAAAMARLIQSERVRSELVRTGLLRAKEFSWKICAQKTLDVYLRAINSS